MSTKPTTLHFIFDRMPDADGCRFIEVEDVHGSSVKAGAWNVRPDGLAELVVFGCFPVPCCQATPEEEALLAAGEFNPEELFGAGGKPSCPDCYAPKQPPALGGEPEALERARKIELLREEFEQRFKLDIWAVIHWLRNSGINDRAHLAPLQAEIERLWALCVEKDERMAAMNESWARCISQRDQLKARCDELEYGLRIIATAGTKTRAPDLRMKAKQTLNRALSKPAGSDQV